MENLNNRYGLDKQVHTYRLHLPYFAVPQQESNTFAYIDIHMNMHTYMDRKHTSLYICKSGEIKYICTHTGTYINTYIFIYMYIRRN